MSSSSLWGIDKEYRGEKIEDFNNSWLFSPIIWDVLSVKYIPREERTGRIGSHVYGISPVGHPEMFDKINKSVCECDNVADTVLWELSAQNIFSTKDKQMVAYCIMDFANRNQKYKLLNDDEPPLKLPNVYERFKEIAKSIIKLDAEKYPYFAIKNTTVDDEVMRWFERCVECNGVEETEKITLNQNKEFVTYFVKIKNGKIVDLVSNLDFDYHKAEFEMPQYIERKKALDLIERYDKDTAIREIKRLSAANVRLVVHGYWKPLYDTDADRKRGMAMRYECSECGRVSNDETYSHLFDYEFCPYCGAKMDLKDGDNNDL